MLTWWLDEVFFETFLFRKWVLWISELQEMFLKYDEKSEIVWCILILLEYNLRRSLACTVGHSFGKGLMVEKDKEKYRYPDYHLKSEIETNFMKPNKWKKNMLWSRFNDNVIFLVVFVYGNVVILLASSG